MPIEINCPSCGTKLRIPDNLLGSAQGVKCPKCSTSIFLPAPAASRTPDPEPLWYIAKNQKRQGPFSYSQLQDLARSGQPHSTDMIWREGTAKWVQADSIDGLIPTLTPPAVQVPTPVPEPLQPKAEWFERGMPLCFEPVEGVFCGKCMGAVRFVEVHGDYTVTCPSCGRRIRLDPSFLAGVVWQNYAGKVKETLERWDRGAFGDEFPEGAFSELKRQHEKALASAMHCYRTLQQLLATPGSDPGQIDQARQQLMRWHGQASKLHEDRKRAIRQIKRAAVGRMTRPGTKLVFTEDDVRSVPEPMVPPLGSPDHEGYEVIPGDEPPGSTPGRQPPSAGVESGLLSSHEAPRRKNPKDMVWMVLLVVAAVFTLFGTSYAEVSLKSPGVGRASGSSEPSAVLPWR